MAEAVADAGVGSFGVGYGLYNMAWGAGLLSGPAVAGWQVGKQTTSDLAKAELLAFPILFLLSLWIFRGLIAAKTGPGALLTLAARLAK